jgi:hypothetical protein
MICYGNRSNKGCTSSASNRSNPNPSSCTRHQHDERGKTSALQYWPSTLNLADRLCMSSSARLRTPWRETECTRWGLRVLTDILQAAVDVRPDACPPSMRGMASATTMRGSGEAAGSPPSVQSAVEEKSSDSLGEESERKSERRERYERLGGEGIYGACHETTRRLALLPQACRRSLALRPPRGWPCGNARFGGIHRVCVEGALTRVRAEKMRESRNPINGLLAPRGMFRLFTGYQTRPICLVRVHVSIVPGKFDYFWLPCSQLLQAGENKGPQFPD